MTTTTIEATDVFVIPASLIQAIKATLDQVPAGLSRGVLNELDQCLMAQIQAREEKKPEPPAAPPPAAPTLPFKKSEVANAATARKTR